MFYRVFAPSVFLSQPRRLWEHGLPGAAVGEQSVSVLRSLSAAVCRSARMRPQSTAGSRVAAQLLRPGRRGPGHLHDRTLPLPLPALTSTCLASPSSPPSKSQIGKRLEQLELL